MKLALDVFREWIAMKFIKLAMLIATKDMELAIAKGIFWSFSNLIRTNPPPQFNVEVEMQQRHNEIS